MKMLLTGVCLLFIAASHADTHDENKAGKKKFARDYPVIWSTPDNMNFVNMVAEKAGRERPDIRRFNSVVNAKAFCTSMEAKDPDAIAISRDMTSEELERCRSRGVTDVIRIKLGDEAIVFVAGKAAKLPPLNEKIIWRAFSRDVFAVENDENSPVVPNPHNKWKDLDKSFPDIPIQLLSMRSNALDESFKAVGLEYGCREYPWIGIMKYHRHFRAHFRAICHGIRRDGKVVSIGKGEPSLTDRLSAEKNALGLMMYTDWNENSASQVLLPVNGVVPSLKTIKDGSYPLVRSHYVFIKKANLAKIPRLAKYIEELSGDAAIGSSGYITKMSLVPTMSASEARSMVVMPVPKMK